MLVLPQMCQVSSCLVSSAGVESECDSTHRPHHQGEEPPCRQPDTAEMTWRVIGLTLVVEPILQQQRSLVHLFIMSLKFE